MQIETRRFGTLEIDEESTFALTSGIPGFPDMRHVALFAAGAVPGHDGSDEPAMYWMQDVDNGDLAFLCLVPWVAFPEYDIEFDERSLGISDDADIRVLSLVTTHREDGAAHLTANLRAPLVVDARSRRLQQVILPDSRWPIRAPFAELVTSSSNEQAS
ncbi:MAG: flagellar assembly protein FliW [Actinobacteria bacterium]|nr:flagellar assembly protein FliW [Actinomycetota bacterium]